MSRTANFSAGVLTLGLAAGFTTGFAKPKPEMRQEPAAAAPAPIPAGDAAKKNPVKPTAGGMADAKKLYGYHCAMCHGKDGEGKGDLAADMKLALTDWGNPGCLAKFAKGDVFYTF